jgi:DNA-binding CsgD family transcriptional regulator
MLLEARKGLRLDQGRLASHDPASDARLRRLAADGRGGELRLAAQGSPGLIVYMHPCVARFGDAGYMTIRVVDLAQERHPLNPALLCDRLGLSRRQAEVVAELAAGRTEAEAAEKLKLAVPILHTHIRRVYDRLDLKSRAELLALLARHGFDTTRDRRKI